MRRKKYVQLSLVIALICILGISSMIFIYKQANVNAMQSSNNDAVYAAALTTDEVITVQTKLKRWGYFDGPITGYYGPLTTEAVKYFQRVNGIEQTGTVGPITARALGMTLSSSGTTASSDLYLLAKCIYAEARGESYVGQVAVGAVILNRVKSPSFPNTISGVIYQPWAFTAVHDGQINLEPNATAYQAARDALNGWDPTYGSIYYYNPATATSAWIWSREVTVVIGRHTFAR
ncbi:MAG: spore cortex-lytic enzyme [Clostridia bacterium]|nr:spore cortex-lytic enzyme [Clostridia bacterium]